METPKDPASIARMREYEAAELERRHLKPPFGNRQQRRAAARRERQAANRQHGRQHVESM